MSTKIDFTYLSEPDMIAAGVMDAARCVEVCEETFSLLGKGDYLMGGANHNSHGMNIVFPKETKFPNMPVAGPDRRFAAMPGYLGGRFDVCGNKWYGSNHGNIPKGLPRSILTMMLNDKDTGAPLALMSANLLSAARTGAVPGAAAKHLANKNSKTLSVVGCGPINKACFEAIITQLPAIEKVVCLALHQEQADAFADWVRDSHGIAAIGTVDAEAAFRDMDVITLCVSRGKPLTFKDEWIKPGATLLVSGPVQPEDAFLTNCRIVYDHTPLHENYVEDAIASGNKDGYYSSVIGGPLYRLIDAGKLPALKDSTGLGDVVNGVKQGRTSPSDRVIFIACGMSVFDISWGFEVLQTAREKGIGQSLNLWDQPAQG
ncbi:tyramine oxidase subunit B [Pseudaquabacterium rugosum]|uniref:Tyramine oxidase subunit B n=1 Tax=Pseudaquabacterium rugosum TaxID=2984194 RepID=A0ABU9BB45_9BURK